MTREGYIRIMRALVSLMITIMVEVGRVPLKSAKTVGENVLKAVIGGGSTEEKETE